MLLFICGTSAYALTTSTKNGKTYWAQQTATTETVTLSGDVYLKGPIIIPNGVTLTIKRQPVATGIEGNIHIRPAEDYVKHASYPTCLFYVAQGGKLVIQGQDINNSYISLNGNSAGYAILSPVDESGASLINTTDVRAARDKVVTNLENKTYLDFVNGGMICAVGTVDISYVRLYGMYATSGRAGAIYRPEQNSTTKYVYGPIDIKHSRITNNRTSFGAAIMINRQISTATDLNNNTPESCRINLVDVDISSNYTMTNGDGGAIRSSPDVIGNMYLTQCKIYRNYTYGRGGAIYWNARASNDTKLIISDTNIERNHSCKHGAGIMLEGSIQFNKIASRSFISGNVAESDDADTDGDGYGMGGGIYLRTSGILRGSVTTPTINVNLGANVSIKNNKAYNGAGVALNLVSDSYFTSGTDVNINLSGLNVSGNIAAHNGGGVYLLDNNKTLDVNIVLSKGSTIVANRAEVSGGGIYFEKGQSMTTPAVIKFNGGRVAKNRAKTGSGGGINVVGHDVTSDQDATGITVAANVSKTNGGGISLEGSSMTISNGVIGGAQPLTDEGVLDTEEAVDHGDYGNKSETGGGVYVTNATFAINGGTIKNNKTTSLLNGGGGVAAFKSTVTVSGGTVEGNDSGTANGGGLYLENCNSTFIGGAITGNKTVRGEGEDGLEINNTGFGGGVYVMEKNGTSKFVLKGDSQISGNSACSGAGVLLNGGDFDMIGGAIDNNRSEWHGGAICVIKADSFNLTSGDITNNTTASKNGGAIYYKVEGGTININGANISRNTSETNVGGAIYVEAGSLSITDGTLSYNTSGNNGGAINFNSPNGQLTVNGGSVSYNTAEAGNGGGIYVGNGDMTILGGVIDHNQVTSQLGAHGGGVSFMPKDSGMMIMDGGVISNNSASGNAGGIFFCAGTMEIRKGEIFGNTANQEGGGLGMRDVANFPSPTLATISGGKIYSNRANLGGGIHLETTGQMRLTDGEIYDNECSYQGGGMNIEKSGGVTIDNGTIRNNRAIHTNSEANPSGNGAGILLGANGGHLVINGGTIKENSGWSGSGIYMSGGSCTITGGTITSNNAERNGGALYLSGGTGLDIENGLIENNVAANMGGGIVIDSQSTVTVNISGGRINTNQAPLGGGLVASKPGSIVNMTGGEICNNTARVGGGVYLSDAAALTFGNGFIVNNKAIRMADVTTATTGCYAEQVAASQYQGVGGGVCIADAKMSFDLETTIGLYGNQADLLGDDLYSTGGGDNVSVTLPYVKDMNLTGYQSATTDLQWMEDYVNGDTGYANGTRGNTSNSYVPKRYRQALADKDNVYTVDVPQGGRTFTTTYLALALGYDIMHLTLQRKGLMKGENAIYKISKWNETSQKWENYAQVLVSGSQEATTPELAAEMIASKTIAVYAGKWRAEEIGWDWSYAGTTTIERELSSATPKEDRYFIFNAAKDTSMSANQQSESVVINNFGTKTVITK